MRAPRVLSLFSGLGGLDAGFIAEGLEIALACDFEPAAVATYKSNLGGEASVLDLALHDLAELPSADVLIGGPPCQSFSLVGQRLEDDPRSLLVLRFLEAIRIHRPQVFVMENVPGIVSSKIEGRRVVDVVVDALEQLGYVVDPHMVMATDYLVPQRRRRLFLVGGLGFAVRRPDPGHFARTRIGVDPATVPISASAAIGDLGSPVPRGEMASYARPPSQLAALFRADSQEAVAHHEAPRMSETDAALVSHIPPGGNYQNVPDEIATRRILRFKETGGRTTTYGRLHPDRPAFTINTYFRRPNVGAHFHYSEPRLITAREAMRFQAMPDEWRITHSRQDQRNALIGNAVPPLVARAFAASVAETLAARSRKGSRNHLESAA